MVALFLYLKLSIASIKLIFLYILFLLCSSRLAGSEDDEEEGPWRLYFKLYCFLDVESMPKEGVEFAFMFEQVNYSFNNSLYNFFFVNFVEPL